MKGFLSKHWFLLTLPAVVGLAWLWPEAGMKGGWLRTEVTTKIGVMVIFFLQGLALPFGELRAGMMNLRLHGLVQGFTFVGFPLLGLALGWMVGGWGPEDLGLGFLFLCVLPSTISSSVVLTTMAKGNTSGAICNAVLSNVLGVFITPLWAAWLVRTGGGSLELGPVVVEIVGLLLLPLVLGQVARLKAGAWAAGRKKVMGNAGSGIILFVVFAAFCNSVGQGVWTGHGTELLGLALVGVGVVFGVASGLVVVLVRLMKLTREDGIAATFCATQKTLASGVPLAAILFGDHPGLGLILLPILLYHPLQLFVHGLLASRWGQAG